MLPWSHFPCRLFVISSLSMMAFLYAHSYIVDTLDASDLSLWTVKGSEFFPAGPVYSTLSVIWWTSVHKIVVEIDKRGLW